MEKTKVIVIRHTNTGYVGMYYLGKTNVPITEDGIEHARKISELLAKEKIDLIYSSGLKRAIMTAEEIAKPHNLKVEHNLSFNEVDFGVMDGLTRGEVEKRYPGLAEERDGNRENFKPPEGESYNEAKQRVMPAIRLLFDSNPGKTIVVVMHGFIMKMIFNEITGKRFNDTEEYIGFGCRMRYEKTNNGIVFTGIENDVKPEYLRK